jgi:prephenate dehydrogenase
MGSSLALSLRARGAAQEVEFVDPDEVARQHVTGLGFAAESRASLLPSEPDAVILAAPPAAIERLLPDVARTDPHALLTDIASVKRPVMEVARGVRSSRPDLMFVGSHPVAGTERQGALAADEAMFAGRPVAICSLAETPNPVIASVERMWLLLGAQPVLLSAEEHDRWLSLTSHLPLLAAAAVAQLGEENLTPGTLGESLIGPGYRDTTRLAASPVGMWIEILSRNADQVVPRLRQLAAGLTRAADQLEDGWPVQGGGSSSQASSQREFRSWLNSASRFRQRLEGE